MSITLRWLPNSWVEIVAPETVIHVDPAISPSVPYEEPDDLAPADLVLITHHHRDHCSAETLALVAAAGDPVYTTALCGSQLDRRVHVVSPGDEFDDAGAHVRVVEAYNTPEGASTQKAHARGECVGFVITVDGIRIYHAGDTDLIPEMSGLGEIDVALLPVGGVYTMDAEEAARAAALIRPAIAIPVHNRDTDPDAFARAMSGSGIEVVTLPPDGELELDLEAEQEEE